MTNEEKVASLESQLRDLEGKVQNIEKECCSTSHVEQRIKTNILLEQLTLNFNKIEKTRDRELLALKEDYSNRMKDISTELTKWRTYQNYLLGGVAVIYFLGIDDKIKALIGG